MPLSRHARCLCLLLASFPALGRKPDPQLIERAREAIRAYLARLPDYVCRVDIDRYQWRGRSLPHKLDHLALEVAFVGGREFYARPEQKGFHSALEEFARGGALSTGSYALHIREVFTTDHAEFTDAHTARRSGVSGTLLTFRIPRERSPLIVSDGRNRGPAGYAGTALLQPDTFDLEELEVVVTAVPPGVGIAHSSEVTRYRRVSIGDREVSLPSHMELLMESRTGLHLRNDVTFRDCRRYTADVNIRFDAPPF